MSAAAVDLLTGLIEQTPEGDGGVVDLGVPPFPGDVAALIEDQHP